MAARAISPVDPKTAEEGYVGMMNDMLSQLHVGKKLTTLQDAKASVFVTLYEGLCGEQLKGVVRRPHTREDEMHNAQMVIDALSLDVLHTSMSHITGEALVDGDPVTIINLIEVFTALMEYIMNRIDSDVGTDNDEGDEHDLEDDPDRVTPAIIDDVLSRELGKGYRDPTTTVPTSTVTTTIPTATVSRPFGSDQSRDSSHGSNKAEWIIAGDSPPQKGPKSGLSDSATGWDPMAHSSMQNIDHSGNSTLEIIRESERVEKRLREEEELKKKAALDRVREDAERAAANKPLPLSDDTAETSDELHQPTTRHLDPGEFAEVGMRPRSKSPYDAMSATAPPTTYTHHLYHHFQDYDGNSRPPVGDITRPTLAATVPMATDVTSQKPRYKSGPPTSGRSAVTGKPPVVKSSKTYTDPTRPGPSGYQPPKARKTHLSGPERSAPKRSSPEKSRVTKQPLSSSYENLSLMVEDTAEMAREAVRRSPVRMADDREAFLSAALRARLDKLHGTAGDLHDLTRSADLSRPRPRNEKLCRTLDPLTRGSGSSKDNLPERSGGLEKCLRGIYDSRAKQRPVEMTLEDLDDDDDDDELSQHSDTEIDYRRDSYLEEDEASPPNLRSKHVRFDEHYKGPRHLKAVRQKVDKEDRLNTLKTGLLRRIYQNELNDIHEEQNYRLNKSKKKAENTDKAFKKGVLLSPQRKFSKKRKAPPMSPARKARTGYRNRMRSASASPPRIRQRGPLTIQDGNILPVLLDEFPYLYMSSETMHNLWRKSFSQIERVSKAAREVKTRKSVAQVQLEEAQKRQEVLSNLIRKEMSHNQRLKEHQLRAAQQKSVKTRLQDKRIQSARARRYYEEFDLQMRAKMLKKRTKEEMLFKKLFREGLDIQRERIRELQKYAKEQKDKKAKIQKDQIHSMENFYRDQFSLLAESMTRQRTDLVVRENAQARVLEQMKRELRKKMEKEIREFQGQLQRDDDDIFHRELDAERLVHDLYRARYKPA